MNDRIAKVSLFFYLCPQCYQRSTMPKYRSHSDVLQDLQTGKTTCVELVQYYLGRIEATKNLNIYVEVFADEALARAAELDARHVAQPSSIGRLFGVVIAIKDVICYQGHEVTAGSKILQGFHSLFSATAVERLIAEDAIIIGRVNCDEFAMGSGNENSYYGPVRNAADPERVPGGSSGGSAAAVQADTCLAALGSDTGGSVRQPAAFCGIVGFKPSYGRISRHGLIAYGSSLDQIGILSHSVEDAALLLEVMAGPDGHDNTARDIPVEAYTAARIPERPVRIACFRAALEHPGLDDGIRKLSFNFIKKLQDAGHLVEFVEFEYLDFMIPAYYVLAAAEASSNLSRYDGVRFGYRSANASDLQTTYTRSRTEGFGEEVKRRIMLGAFVLSAGYYDAYFSKAQQVRRLIHDRTKTVFANYDFILMPAAPSTAWRIGAKKENPVEAYLADIFTVQANLAGIPAIALPVEPHPADNMPVGIQLMADAFQEAKLFAFAKSIKSV